MSLLQCGREWGLGHPEDGQQERDSRYWELCQRSFSAAPVVSSLASRSRLFENAPRFDSP